MAKYRKKPVVIEAAQWSGHNWNDIQGLLDGQIGRIRYDEAEASLYITTLEGVMRADASDYIIKGVNGELYPCKPDIFAKTYEAVE